MLILGLVALIVGGLMAYNGYQSVQRGLSIDAALGAAPQPQDYTWMWVGIVLAVVGAVLLLIRWTIAAARK